MSAMRIVRRRGVGLALAMGLVLTHGVVRAQGVAAPIPPVPSASPAGEILQTGCASCGGGSGLAAGGGCSTCGGGPGCIPGRDNRFCCGWCPESAFGRFLAGFYECVCCPDPCYEPTWRPVADSAFFVDAARPVTQMRLRYDRVWDYMNPDRAEFLWARQRTNPNQLGPGMKQESFGKGPGGIARRVDYQELSMYTEGATGAVGVFVDVPYRHVDPDTAAAALGLPPAGPPGAAMPPFSKPASGFADMTIGTKTLFLDCELLQIAFQFKTYLPTGAFTKGLGTGHVSLEPSLLFNVRLAPETYLQAQVAYWIPIGGDDLYQGNVYHGHASLNQVLWKPCCGLELVGTFEASHYCVLGGNYTSPDLLITQNNQRRPVALAAEASFLSIGPGVRLFVCEKIDIGVGSAIAVTGSHFAGQQVRAEFRWRF